jgi:hypothetical protein
MKREMKAINRQKKETWCPKLQQQQLLLLLLLQLLQNEALKGGEWGKGRQV